MCQSITRLRFIASMNENTKGWCSHRDSSCHRLWFFSIVTKFAFTKLSCHSINHKIVTNHCQVQLICQLGSLLRVRIVERCFMKREQVQQRGRCRPHLLQKLRMELARVDCSSSGGQHCEWVKNREGKNSKAKEVVREVVNVVTWWRRN